MGLTRQGKMDGRHALAIFVAFFGVVFATNFYFVYRAVSTHTGVVANEPYRKGLNYNERIEAGVRQASLGWTEDIALSSGGERLEVSMKDSAGMPVAGLSISAVIGRPATSSGEVSLALVEVSPGRYEGDIALEAAGAYIASVEAARSSTGEANIVYRARKRLWLER